MLYSRKKHWGTNEGCTRSTDCTYLIWRKIIMEKLNQVWHQYKIGQLLQNKTIYGKFGLFAKSRQRTVRTRMCDNGSSHVVSPNQRSQTGFSCLNESTNCALTRLPIKTMITSRSTDIEGSFKTTKHAPVERSIAKLKSGKVSGTDGTLPTGWIKQIFGTWTRKYYDKDAHRVTGQTHNPGNVLHLFFIFQKHGIDQ